jgi:dipeptidyl-peptidase 4
MIKPADFNPDEKYPVFMYVYGGPGSQTVSHRWNTFNGAWFQMLSQMGYIVVSVDNRGTGGRGVEFEKMTYLQLGKYEAIDQINAAKYLGGLDYVDETGLVFLVGVMGATFHLFVLHLDQMYSLWL